MKVFKTLQIPLTLPLHFLEQLLSSHYDASAAYHNGTCPRLSPVRPSSRTYAEATGVVGYSNCDVIRNSRGHRPNFPFAFKNFALHGGTIRHVRSHQSCRRQPRLKPPRAQLSILYEQLLLTLRAIWRRCGGARPWMIHT